LQVLDSLHSAGLAHRDLKPENVLLLSHTDLVLIDLDSLVDVSEPVASWTYTQLYVHPTAPFPHGKDQQLSDMFAAGAMMAQTLAPQVDFAQFAAKLTPPSRCWIRGLASYASVVCVPVCVQYLTHG
jgi:serine/threonine protein kinase